jgi:hypothetical protein
MKRLFLFLFFIPSFAYAQAGFNPQLKALLDFYFRGPGAENSIDRIQIREGAIDLSRLDVPNVSTLFASRGFVASTYLPLVYTNEVNLTFATKDELNSLSGSVSGNFATITALNTLSNHVGNTYATISSLNSLASSVGNTYATISSLNTLSNHVGNTYATTTSLNTLSNHVGNTYATITSLNTLSNHVGNTYATTASLNTLSNHVGNTYATATSLNALSNYVDTTYSASSFSTNFSFPVSGGTVTLFIANGLVTNVVLE